MLQSVGLSQMPVREYVEEPIPFLSQKYPDPVKCPASSSSPAASPSKRTHSTTTSRTAPRQLPRHSQFQDNVRLPAKEKSQRRKHSENSSGQEKANAIIGSNETKQVIELSDQPRTPQKPIRNLNLTTSASSSPLSSTSFLQNSPVLSQESLFSSPVAKNDVSSSKSLFQDEEGTCFADDSSDNAGVDDSLDDDERGHSLSHRLPTLSRKEYKPNQRQKKRTTGMSSSTSSNYVNRMSHLKRSLDESKNDEKKNERSDNSEEYLSSDSDKTCLEFLSQDDLRGSTVETMSANLSLDNLDEETEDETKKSTFNLMSDVGQLSGDTQEIESYIARTMKNLNSKLQTLKAKR